MSLDMMTQTEPSMTQTKPGIAATQLDSPSPRASATTAPASLAAVTTPRRINRKRAASEGDSPAMGSAGVLQTPPRLIRPRGDDMSMSNHKTCSSESRVWSLRFSIDPVHRSSTSLDPIALMSTYGGAC